MVVTKSAPVRRKAKTPEASLGAGYARLLDAATVEFARNGREGARVEQIAQRAEVSKQLVYHYFVSKDRLYLAVLERAYLRYRGNERSIRKVIDGVDAETAMRGLAKFLYGREKNSVDFQRLLQDANFHGGQGLNELTGVREAYDYLLGAFSEVLRRGAEEGVFVDNVDAREFYISLTGAVTVRRMNAATLSYALGANLLTEEGMARSQEAAINLLLNGIKTRPSR
jgi:AcrR family transcriptional regulator